MDPQFEKTPGLNLPKPTTEQGVYDAQQQSAALLHESMLPPTENTPAFISPAPAVPLQGAHAVSHTITPASPAAAGQAVPATSAAGDDNTDALDEEWINKAKAIVEQTKHDPRMESAQLGKVKAEYLRIRYNKHIKVSEEHSK
jgi:hypothetical protein